MEANGMIVSQSPEFYDYLEGDIIGESDIKDGCKYITTRLHYGEGNTKVVVMKFNLDGKAQV